VDVRATRVELSILNSVSLETCRSISLSLPRAAIQAFDTGGFTGGNRTQAGLEVAETRACRILDRSFEMSD